MAQNKFKTLRRYGKAQQSRRPRHDSDDQQHSSLKRSYVQTMGLGKAQSEAFGQQLTLLYENLGEEQNEEENVQMQKEQVDPLLRSYFEKQSNASKVQCSLKSQIKTSFDIDFQDPLRLFSRNLQQDSKQTSQPKRFLGRGNRYGIKQGLMWDGVERGNGRERLYFQRANNKQLAQSKSGKDYIRGL